MQSRWWLSLGIDVSSSTLGPPPLSYTTQSCSGTLWGWRPPNPKAALVLGCVGCTPNKTVLAGLLHACGTLDTCLPLWLIHAQVMAGGGAPGQLR